MLHDLMDNLNPAGETFLPAPGAAALCCLASAANSQGVVRQMLGLLSTDSCRDPWLQGPASLLSYDPSSDYHNVSVVDFSIGFCKSPLLLYFESSL